MVAVHIGLTSDLYLFGRISKRSLQGKVQRQRVDTNMIDAILILWLVAVAILAAENFIK